MRAQRRFGPVGNDTWNSLLDAVETILIEEGSAALSSRHVAERAGIKQRLLYYYFQTMEELVVATFRRSSAMELERLEKALESNNPLREMWDVYVHTIDIRLISEYMALANRIKALGSEVKKHVEKSRKLQVAALTKTVKGKKGMGSLTPVAAALIATSSALAIHREAKLGIRAGHAEMKALIDEIIDVAEGTTRRRKGARRRS